MYSFWISVIGLSLGTLGAFLVWWSDRKQNVWIGESEKRLLHRSRYAGQVTPSDYDPEAEKEQTLEDAHSQIIEMAKSDRMSRGGILLISIGFALQLVALVIGKIGIQINATMRHDSSGRRKQEGL